MFGDMLQSMLARRLVAAHGRIWLLLYDVPSSDKRHFALATLSDAEGRVVLPAEVQLVEYELESVHLPAVPKPGLKSVP